MLFSKADPLNVNTYPFGKLELPIDLVENGFETLNLDGRRSYH